MTQRQKTAYWFFYHHAGVSYNPSTETKTRGRQRGAAALARAEAEASARGYRFVWSDDWSVGNHAEEYGEVYAEREPSTCESCRCLDENGTVLASLHCIDDATNHYRRVIEAELAAEAITARA